MPLLKEEAGLSSASTVVLFSLQTEIFFTEFTCDWETIPGSVWRVYHMYSSACRDPFSPSLPLSQRCRPPDLELHMWPHTVQTRAHRVWEDQLLTSAS